MSPECHMPCLSAICRVGRAATRMVFDSNGGLRQGLRARGRRQFGARLSPQMGSVAVGLNSGAGRQPSRTVSVTPLNLRLPGHSGQFGEARVAKPIWHGPHLLPVTRRDSQLSRSLTPPGGAGPTEEWRRPHNSGLTSHTSPNSGRRVCRDRLSQFQDPSSPNGKTHIY
jgi:hypothetical protein